MGFLRFYLALCVVSAHSNSVLPWSMHNGAEAVQIFFMISGFYMAMVLSQGYPSIKEFYISRWLRIFIPYYIVLGLIIFCSVISGKLSGNWLKLTPYVSNPLEHNGLMGVIFTAASNITIFFQDWVMFLQHDLGKTFGFTVNFWDNKSPLWAYLIIPPCWSVGIELTFYLLAPYINKLKTKTVLGILAISLTARLFAYHFLGLAHDPWNYRFFPFELAFFLLGMLSWRIYSKYDLPKKIPSCANNYHYSSFCFLFLLFLFFHTQIVSVASRFLSGNDAVLIGYLPFPIIIAVLFAYSKRVSIDRFIGELSYPIYLLHYSLIGVASRINQKLHLSSSYLGMTSAFITVAVSLALLFFVLQPFEKWRHAFLQKMAKKRTGDLGAMAA